MSRSIESRADGWPSPPGSPIRLRELVMASPGAEEPNSLQGLPLDLLRRAVEIYLGIAYPNSEPSPAVRRRLEWTPGVHAGELLSKPPFERVGKAPAEKLIYALRLGNARYPHMKMQIQPWDASHGYLLSVNTHDHALALDPSSRRRRRLHGPPGREPEAQGRDRASLGRSWLANLPPLSSRLFGRADGFQSEAIADRGKP